jgi:hypothetical protein
MSTMGFKFSWRDVPLITNSNKNKEKICRIGKTGAYYIHLYTESSAKVNIPDQVKD